MMLQLCIGLCIWIILGYFIAGIWKSAAYNLQFIELLVLFKCKVNACMIPLLLVISVSATADALNSLGLRQRKMMERLAEMSIEYFPNCSL